MTAPKDQNRSSVNSRTANVRQAETRGNSKQQASSSPSRAQLQLPKARIKKMAARAASGAAPMSASMSASTMPETDDAADVGLLEPADRSTAWSTDSGSAESGLEESHPQPAPFDVDSRAQAKAFFAELQANKKRKDHSIAEESAPTQFPAEHFRQEVLATVQGVSDALEQRLQNILERWEQQLSRVQESQLQSQSRLAESVRNFAEQLAEIQKQLRMGPISELARLDRTCRKELEELRVERDKVSLMLACIPQTIDQRMTEIESGRRKTGPSKVTSGRPPKAERQRSRKR